MAQASQSPAGDRLELGQSFVILGAIRDLFGADQRSERDDVHGDPGKAATETIGY